LRRKVATEAGSNEIKGRNGIHEAQTPQRENEGGQQCDQPSGLWFLETNLKG